MVYVAEPGVARLEQYPEDLNFSISGVDTVFTYRGNTGAFSGNGYSVVNAPMTPYFYSHFNDQGTQLYLSPSASLKSTSISIRRGDLTTDAARVTGVFSSDKEGSRVPLVWWLDDAYDVSGTDCPAHVIFDFTTDTRFKTNLYDSFPSTPKIVPVYWYPAVGDLYGGQPISFSASSISGGLKRPNSKDGWLMGAQFHLSSGWYSADRFGIVLVGFMLWDDSNAEIVSESTNPYYYFGQSAGESRITVTGRIVGHIGANFKSWMTSAAASSIPYHGSSFREFSVIADTFIESNTSYTFT